MLRRILALSIAFVACSAACGERSETAHFRDSVPDFSDVLFVQALPGLPYGQSLLPLTPEEDALQIEELLSELRAARVSLFPVDEAALVAHVQVLTVVLQDGSRALTVVPSYNCRSTGPGATECRPDDRDVVVFVGDVKWRLASPNLARELHNLPMQMRTVSAADYEAFMEAQFPTPPIPDGLPLRAWFSLHSDNGPVPLPLDAANPADALVLGRLVTSLRNAAPGSPDTVRADSQRFDDSNATLNLAYAGRGLSIEAAYICRTDGTNLPCYRSPDEVLVDDPNGFRQPWHLKAPELAQWMASGWKADMRLGTYEEFQRAARFGP